MDHRKRLRRLLRGRRPAAVFRSLAEDRAAEGGARHRRLVAVGGNPHLGLPDDADGRADLPACLLASATLDLNPGPGPGPGPGLDPGPGSRSEEHTSALQSLMRISYAVFCLKKKK